MGSNRSIARLVLVVVVVLSACGAPSTDEAERPGRASAATVGLRDPEVPDLPFEDNPDPDQCGIPVRWGVDDPAWVTGMWEGELIQPDVLLYDSHLRLEISGRLAHGAEVRIELFQENPVLDYYFVRSAEAGVEGWVPAPFLSFEPVRT